MFLGAVTLTFALVKFQHLWTRHNPIISPYEKDFDPNKILDLSDTNFRIAFAVEDYSKPRHLKDEPEFVRWHFRLQG